MATYTGFSENGFSPQQIQYYKESLVYIYYKFIRSDNGEHNIKCYAKIYDDLIYSLSNTIVPRPGFLTKPTSSTDPRAECSTNQFSKYILKLLYKLIAQTRDICYGKGERDITYMMIYTWWKYFPKMGYIALHAMLFSENNSVLTENSLMFDIKTESVYIPHQNSYGCFKDVKYFCEYVRKYGDKQVGNKNNEIIKCAITMLNQRVYDDYNEYIKNGTLPSLAAKWVPRENSKYGWIFEKMAIQWVRATNPVILSSVNMEQYELSFYNTRTSQVLPNSSLLDSARYICTKTVKAIVKCKTIYRKIISLLSKPLELLETKMCQNNWDKIDPATITIDALFRNNNAIFNIDNTFESRKGTIIDKKRMQCSHNIKDYVVICDVSPEIKLEKLRKSYINQRTFSPMQFVKQAVTLINANWNNEITYEKSQTPTFVPNSSVLSNSQNMLYQIDLLNKQWNSFSRQCNALDYFVPILDMSLGILSHRDMLYNAIGMCCLISEKSRISRRIMVMDNTPTWVNLENCGDNFYEMVKVIYNHTTKRTSANIVKTFDTIIQSLSHNNQPSPEREGIIGDVLLSKDNVCNNDMQNILGGVMLGGVENDKMDLVFVVFTSETILNKCGNGMLHSIILDRFALAKLERIPHIVYWNCSPNCITSDDFYAMPVSGEAKKTSMVSGTNAQLLNHFSFIGWGNQYNNSPFETIENIINGSRYDYIGGLFDIYCENVVST